MNIYLKTESGKPDDAIVSDFNQYKKNSLMLFSLIGNADEIIYLLSDGSKSNTMQFSGNWANNIFNWDIWRISENQSSYEVFLRKLDGGGYMLVDSK